MEGRIVQVVLIASIVLLIVGTLVWEQWVSPWLRRRRVRRRHRHAAQVLRAYRSLRHKFYAVGLAEVWAELARPRALPIFEEIERERESGMMPDQRKRHNTAGQPTVLPTMPFDTN